MPLKLQLLTILFSSLIGYAHAQTHSESDWDLVKEEGTIEVFTRNNEDTNLKEIRITLTLESSIAAIEALLNDVPLYTSWVYKCSDSKELETVHSNEFYYYIVLDFPFPLSDRDLVVHSQHRIDEQTGVYYSHSSASPTGLIEEQEDFVRINLFESSWTITPLKDGVVYIDYQAISGPGGDIPIWLVNLAITKGPLETMKQFVELAQSTSKDEKK